MTKNSIRSQELLLLGRSECLTRQSLSEEGEEDGEVDRAGRLLQHVVDLGVAGDGAERRVQIAKVALVDDAILVLVHDAEGLLELLDGLRVEGGGLRGAGSSSARAGDLLLLLDLGLRLKDKK